MNSKGISEKAITLPFSISSYGRVSDTTSSEKIWADKVRSAVGTLVKERIMRPRFGTKVPMHVFDNQSELAQKIKDEVKSVFASYLEQLTLSDVVIAIDDVNSTVSAEIIYSIPGKTETSLNIGLANLTGNSPINEENVW
jgi:phage baseplate assembly protein W